MSLRKTRSRLLSKTMSMKSTTIIPPISRSLNCRTISSAASTLFLVTVSSRFPPAPVNLPVLTSTTVMASVRSITSEPPEGKYTLRSSALSSCSSTRSWPNRSFESVQCSRRSSRSGATALMYASTVVHAVSPETTILLTSSLKISRTTLIAISGSAYNIEGALVLLLLLEISSQRAVSRTTSCSKASSGAPSAAVRTITPASSGMTRLRIDFRRLRSFSGSLRLIPVIEPSGT